MQLETSQGLMKLLYITNGITGTGGLERVLSVKASMLEEDFGYEVHILSLNEEGKKLFFAFSDNITFHTIAVSGNALAYFLEYRKGIQNVVSELRPDVICVCDDALKGFFLPQIIKTHAKWIHESHASLNLSNRGNGVPAIKRIQHHLKQYLGRAFDRIVVLTDRNLSEWSLENLEIIPNPLPFEASVSADLHSKKIIAVGSYSYNKGYDRLLEIWKIVEDTFSDWELHIYGKSTQENLKNESQLLGLSRIYFYEPVPNIEHKYLNSAVFVLPSRSEGFGMVIIEAMSCGLPVVSFDCPHGPADIITDGHDGFLVENGNIEQFAQRLKELMRCEDLRMKMGAKAKVTSEKYDATKIVGQWDRLFKKLLSKNSV